MIYYFSSVIFYLSNHTQVFNKSKSSKWWWTFFSHDTLLFGVGKDIYFLWVYLISLGIIFIFDTLHLLVIYCTICTKAKSVCTQFLCMLCNTNQQTDQSNKHFLGSNVISLVNNKVTPMITLLLLILINIRRKQGWQHP